MASIGHNVLNHKEHTNEISIKILVLGNNFEIIVCDIFANLAKQ